MFETNSDTVVGLTDKALARVHHTMKGEGAEDHGLRLAVVKGGCSGYEYSIKFTAAPEAGDLVYYVGDLPVFVAGDSREKLEGVVLDFVDGLYGGGLKFTNPNAVHECGCGASFATEEPEVKV